MTLIYLMSIFELMSTLSFKLLSKFWEPDSLSSLFSVVFSSSMDVSCSSSSISFKNSELPSLGCAIVVANEMIGGENMGYN